MSLLRTLTRGLANLLRPAQAHADLSEELQQYFDQAVAEKISGGRSPEEARRATYLELGHPTLAQEQVHSFGWENTIRTVLFDLQFAARQLRVNPGFTIVAVLTLVIGIGASTAIFSTVYPVLFESLPYPNPQSLVMIWSTFQGSRSTLAYGTFRELSARNHSFAAMSFFEPWQPTVTGGAQAERFNGQFVSADFFNVLGISPAVGRDFRPDDQILHASKVVILSERLARRILHTQQPTPGTQLKLDDDTFTVIGIMPASFDDVLSPSADLWTPEQFDPAGGFDSGYWGNRLSMLARLKPGVKAESATHELAQISKSRSPDFPRPPWASLVHGFIVDSLYDDIARAVKPALLAVLGAVLLLLAIACVNVINLVLARNAQRRAEFTTRKALGASRLRITRQLLTENLLLALLGGCGGLGLASFGVRTLVALNPSALPRLSSVAINYPVFAFAVTVTTLVGLLAGLIQALSGSSSELQVSLRETLRQVAGGHALIRQVLVVSEVALALVLLIGAGLLLRSMQHILAVDPGFHVSNLLTLQVQTSGHQFDNPKSGPAIGDIRRRRFFTRSLEAVRNVPGVQAAAFTSILPLSDDTFVSASYGAQFEGDPPNSGHSVFRYAISSGYCQTMAIPLVAGRCLDDRDVAGAPQSALISESLAKSRFLGQSALGNRLHLGPTDRPWYTVVGVVADVKQFSLALNQSDAVYISTEQSWFADDALSFVVRTSGDPQKLSRSISNAIWSIDKNQPIVRLASMDSLRAKSEAQRHFVLTMFEVFGLVALALQGVGIYGIVSASVTERTREIGLRSALGASQKNNLSLVLSQGMRLTMLGLTIGLIAAIAATRTVTTLLFGVSGLDPFTYLAVAVILIFVSVLACIAPAWRVLRLDPATTLRAE